VAFQRITPVIAMPAAQAPGKCQHPRHPASVNTREPSSTLALAPHRNLLPPRLVPPTLLPFLRSDLAPFLPSNPLKRRVLCVLRVLRVCRWQEGRTSTSHQVAGAHMMQSKAEARSGTRAKPMRVPPPPLVIKRTAGPAAASNAGIASALANPLPPHPVSLFPTAKHPKTQPSAPLTHSLSRIHLQSRNAPKHLEAAPRPHSNTCLLLCCPLPCTSLVASLLSRTRNTHEAGTAQDAPSHDQVSSRPQSLRNVDTMDILRCAHTHYRSPSVDQAGGTGIFYEGGG